MEKYHIGEIVRYLRKEKKMTQEELSEGICSPVTISRIESGTQMPSDRVIDQILDRLGSDIYQTANIIRDGANPVFQVEFSRIEELINSGDFQEASNQLSTLEEDVRKDKKIDCKTEQYFILLKTAILLQSNDSDLNGVIETIKDAISLTKHNFNYSDFSEIPLTLNEVNLLNVLCVAYYRTNRREEAISLLHEIIKMLSRHKNSFLNNQELILNAYINLSQMLEEKESFDKALELCEQAIKISKETKYQMFFSELQFFKAKLLFKIGRKDEGIKLFKIISPYMELQGKDVFVKLIEPYLQ